MISRALIETLERNADYGGTAHGVLIESEVYAMNAQVDSALASTNGDAGDCVISARQLALLLKAVAQQERRRENLARVRKLVEKT